jgi:hypothetical protein
MLKLPGYCSMKTCFTDAKNSFWWCLQTWDSRVHAFSIPCTGCSQSWGQGLLPHAKPLISDCPWALLYNYFTTSLLLLSHHKALRGILLCMYLEGTLYPWIWILDSHIGVRSLALLNSTHKFPLTTSQSRYV